MTETIETAADIAAQQDALTTRRAELMQRQRELQAAVEAARQQQGAALVSGGIDGEAMRAAHEMCDELEGVGVAIEMLTRELDALSPRQADAKKAEARRELEQSLAAVDAARGQAEAAFLTFWDGEFQEHRSSMDDAMSRYHHADSALKRLQGSFAGDASLELRSPRRPYKVISDVIIFVDDLLSRAGLRAVASREPIGSLAPSSELSKRFGVPERDAPAEAGSRPRLAEWGRREEQ